jgi:hypothetical protein
MYIEAHYVLIETTKISQKKTMCGMKVTPMRAQQSPCQIPNMTRLCDS